MAQQTEPSSFLKSLSQPRGVLMAAPAIIGAALLLKRRHGRRFVGRA